MKYFEKTAVGPEVHNIVAPGGYYLSPKQIKQIEKIPGAEPVLSILKGNIKNPAKVKKHGIVNVGVPYKSLGVKFKDIPQFLRDTPEEIRTHELTHWLRYKKGKRSAINYEKPLWSFIDEIAAYRRGGKSVGRSLQAATWSVLFRHGQKIPHGKNLLNFIAKL